MTRSVLFPGFAPGTPEFRLLDLEALVTMKLTSYRDKDRVHLRDMLEIGQIDETWLKSSYSMRGTRGMKRG